MDEHCTPAARRSLIRAAELARESGWAEVEPWHVVCALLEQEESRGATLLRQCGLQPVTTLSYAQSECRGVAQETVFAPSQSATTRSLLASVAPRNRAELGTEQMLAALLTDVGVRDRLASSGCDVDQLDMRLQSTSEESQRPIPPDFEQLDTRDLTDEVDLYRILDACANRAREGLRVVEDLVRFAWDDRWLCGELKALRHEFSIAYELLPRPMAMLARETRRDVGTGITVPTEQTRSGPTDVLIANFRRVQEAMRSLEEVGKIESAEFAKRVEALRYRTYTLERSTGIGIESRRRLDGVTLYLLVTGSRCVGGLEWTVREAFAGGAQVVQLREKNLPDRELLATARMLRRLSREAAALFIVNDRPDIARLADADGVHVGQDEFSVKDARRIVGLDALVGVSTHSMEQARQAVLDGANYIGVGPTFASGTKSFESLAGLEFVRQVSDEIRLPAFVIGGVTLDRVESIRSAGGRRVAVSEAICAADDPRRVASELRQRMG